MTAHLHWSINITDKSGFSDYVVIIDTEMRQTTGGVNECVGGIASATSIYNSSYPPSNAFDANSGTFWISAEPFVSPQRIAYQFISPVDITEYQLFVFGTDGVPVSWTVEYSDDGVNWTVAGQETNYIFSGGSGIFTISVPIYDVEFINRRLFADNVQLANTRISATDVAFINRRLNDVSFTNRRISATDITLTNQRTASTDITLSNSLIDAHDVTFHSRNIEITAVDIALIIPRVAITAVDVAFINVREQYTISRTDVAFINHREEDYQSIVIDVHNPETPVFGNYS